jgi:hypothetical protein
VKTLVDKIAEAGQHTTFWNGRDDGGRPVASGLYFMRMETGGFTATRKLTLIK